jgi:uncharacterized protein YdeI (YjbR/CyaY-like superfamily)
MTEKEITTFYPTDRQHWRAWLAAHHAVERAVWLIFYEAVDEALCFGWIDSIVKPIDEEKYMRFFSKRKATGTWSAVNKEKIKKLIEENLITEAGFEAINLAKQNGSWAILDDVEALLIPDDMEKQLQAKPNAKDTFSGWSKSDRKYILHWINQARRPETRQKRIHEIVEIADHNLNPKAIRWTKK